MTIKEISELTGKTQRCIRNWANLSAENISSIKEKISVSTSTYPADFTKDEVIEIIKAGGNNLLAELLNQSSQPQDTSKLISETITAIMPLFQKMMVETIKAVQVQQPQQQIEFKQDYYSLLGYCRMKKIILNFSEAISISKQIAKECKEKNIEIRKVPDERYGQVNSYPIDMIEKYLSV